MLCCAVLAVSVTSFSDGDREVTTLLSLTLENDGSYVLLSEVELPGRDQLDGIL